MSLRNRANGGFSELSDVYDFGTPPSDLPQQQRGFAQEMEELAPYNTFDTEAPTTTPTTTTSRRVGLQQQPLSRIRGGAPNGGGRGFFTIVGSVTGVIALILMIIAIAWLAVITGLWIYNLKLVQEDIDDIEGDLTLINASIPEGNGTVFFDDEFTIANGAEPGRKFMFNASLVSKGIKRNYAFPDDDGIVLLDTTLVPVFPEDEFAIVGDTDPTTRIEFDLSLIPGSTLHVYNWPNKDGTVALLSDVISGINNNTEFLDSEFAILNDPDTSRRAMFDASQISLMTNRTFIFPDLDGELCLTSGAQTITDKVIDSTTNTVTADNLHSATTTIDVSSATAPTAGQVLTATSATAATWQTPSTSGGGTVNSAFINDSRSFPDMANEGTTTIGGLNATAMYITIWGAGGGGGGSFFGTTFGGGGGGGSGGAVVNFPLDSFMLALMGAESFTVVIGAGGIGGGNATDGTDGGLSSARATDGGTTFDVFLQAYGGGGGVSDGDGGGGAGSGGSASGVTGGAANGVGGGAGPDGGLDNSGGSQVTLYWTGWGGGNSTNGVGGESRGSDFFNRGRGGDVGNATGGGAGGFAGKGGDGGISASGESAAANSGAGGGGGDTGGGAAGSGGDGGSGGAYFIWWTQ